MQVAIKFNREKFKALVLYICSRTESAALGNSKLNKILWHSDTKWYLLSGSPLTGATYIKHQHGPVACGMETVLQELQVEGALAIRDGLYGRQDKEFFALHLASLELFTASEISLVDAEIDRICYSRGMALLGGESHDAAWTMAAIGEELPYHAVFAERTAELAPTDVAWARQELSSLTVGASENRS